MSAKAPEQRDSRRLTGPNLLWDRPGAVIDAGVADAEAGAFVEAWRTEARRMLDAVGWKDEGVCARVVPGGAILALSAPMDALYAATEVNEWAFASAAARSGAEAPPPLDEAAGRLIGVIAAERNPALLALRAEAERRGVTALSDDEFLSIGLGKGSRAWPVTDLPAPDAVQWDALHDVPVALVTGTNGKTTTVRLLASIARAAGLAAGTTSTDGIAVAGETIDAGDYSGPGGARTLLRDSRVDVAILESARGGMLRRGLAVPRANAAAVTNVAEDHLGEFGVHDARALAEAKLVVARAVRDAGALLLNADEPLLRELGPQRAHAAPAWFSLAPEAAGALLEAAPRALWFDGRAIAVRERRDERAIAHVDAIPVALGGAARHNVANALAAVGIALALGWSDEAIARGLAAFDGSASDNPGRGNVRMLGGVRVIVDFAHNPHGMEAMVATALALPAVRRHVVLGQAGDRDDASIRALVRSAWKLAPARVVVKELAPYLRGRKEGEVPSLIESELRALGCPPEAIVRVPDEETAAREVLRGSREGDLVLMPVHADRDAVTALLDRMEAEGWRAGESVPL